MQLKTSCGKIVYRICGDDGLRFSHLLVLVFELRERRERRFLLDLIKQNIVIVTRIVDWLTDWLIQPPMFLEPWKLISFSFQSVRCWLKSFFWEFPLLHPIKLHFVVSGSIKITVYKVVWVSLYKFLVNKAMWMGDSDAIRSK